MDQKKSGTSRLFKPFGRSKHPSGTAASTDLPEPNQYGQRINYTGSGLDPTAAEDPSATLQKDDGALKHTLPEPIEASPPRSVPQSAAEGPSAVRQKDDRTVAYTLLEPIESSPTRRVPQTPGPSQSPSPRADLTPSIDPRATGFKKTVTSFRNKLVPSQLYQVECNSLSDLYVVINRIQHEQRDQKAMMNLTRIKAFLEAMQQFENVVVVYLNVSNLVAFIWGPIKFLLQLASTWADGFDTLLDAYAEIGDHIPLLQQYQDLFQDSIYMQNVLNLMYGDIMKFHEHAIHFFSDKVGKQVFKSLWKNFRTKFQHILDDLQRHKKLIESQAVLSQNSQYQLHRKTTEHALERIESHQQSSFRQYEIDRDKAADDFEKTEAAQQRQKMSDILQCLCSTDNAAHHELACEARQGCAESGRWVLRHPKVQAWKDAEVPSNPLLWLNGIPGAGKSVLASVIIEDCLNLREYQTAYFYCAGNDSQQNTCIAVLRGLLSQLFQRCDSLLPYWHERLKSGETVLTSMQLAKQLLELFCEQVSKVILIVDGLDECNENEQRVLVNYLTALVGKVDGVTPGKLRLLIVSQVEGHIKKLLSTAATLTISVEYNGDDIRTFIRQRLVQIAATFELDDAQIEYVETATYAGASGMFLFAKLVLENLLAQPTKKAFCTELQESVFPTELHEAYERIMSRIKSRTEGTPALWTVTVKLLGWMTCAKRPLRWHEIQAAASIDCSDRVLNFDEKKFRFDIEDLCGSLIIEMAGKRLALVHSTAKRYILDNKHISVLEVECQLTTLCLGYLTFPAFDSSPTDEELNRLVRTGQLAFHDYAVANWTYHLLALTKSAQGYHDGGGMTDNKIEFGSSTQYTEFEIALEEFMSCYEDDLINQDIQDEADEACRAFASSPYFDQFKELWSHCQWHTAEALAVRNKVSLPTLEAALGHHRSMLEEISTAKKGEKRPAQDLDQYYGKNRFKCPKVTCFWFHEGLSDHKIRQNHVSRHERPFRCDVADCSAQDLGLKNAKDLEKHTKTFHPALDQQAVALFTSTKEAPTKTPHACHLCEKRFTRKFHLTSHIRNHKQEKPFACPECGRAFTRMNDCKRHEKIHSRRG